MRASRLVAFGLLAALATAMWSRLLADPPVVRLVAVWAIAVALAGALTLAGRIPARPLRAAASIVLAAIAALAGLAALGLPIELLAPGRWDELGPVVRDGIDGLRGELELPVGDLRGIARPLLLAALPPLLALAALLGAPEQRRGNGLAALAMLIIAFAIPAASRPGAAAGLWGVALLAAIALWLWGARVAAPAAIAAIGVAAAVAVPVAAAIEPEEPPVDYERWTLPEPPEGTDFEWDHRYGPIDWTRSGDTLLEVRTDDPHYLRATVLDEFYAYGWRRSPSGGPATPPPEPPARDRWEVSAELSVRGLESRELISPGEPVTVTGVAGFERSADGTLSSSEEPLVEGSDYTVYAYAPDPGPARMRAASRAYDPELAPYTALTLPADPEVGAGGVVTVAAPLIGTPTTVPAAVPDYVAPGYVRASRLADRLVAGQPSGYDAAVAVREHLADGFEYDERPPSRDDPLPAFLFSDRRGYCQQFSGAMAMLLRMGGVPARVAGGFTPGERVLGQDELFEVTDLDAHSWVEVYFNGIGWVPFDPTPADSPAGTQSSAGLGAVGGLGAAVSAAEELARAREPALDGGRADAANAAADDGSGSGPVLAVSLLVAVCLLAGIVALRSFRHRRLPDEVRLERAVRELSPALSAAGRTPEGSATLLELERDLRSAGRPRAAAYLAEIGAVRFRPSGGAPPGLGARRRARRDLGEGRGIGERWRLLLAMPPGAPSGST